MEIEWIIFLSGLALTGGSVGVYQLNLRLGKGLKQSYKKVSDGELLRLVGAHVGGNITLKQVKRQTGLTGTQAAMRLNQLEMGGGIKTFYDSTDFEEGYAVKDANLLNLPVTPKPASEITNDDLVRLAESCNGYLSKAAICVAFDVSLKDAKKLFKNLRKAGLLEKQYNENFQAEYRLPRSQNPTATPLKKLRNGNLNDAAIIQLAVERGGVLTATALCVAQEIAYEKAEERLNAMQEKGIFQVLPNAESGALEYHLLDKSLLAQ